MVQALQSHCPLSRRFGNHWYVDNPCSAVLYYRCIRYFTMLEIWKSLVLYHKCVCCPCWFDKWSLDRMIGTILRILHSVQIDYNLESCHSKILNVVIVKSRISLYNCCWCTFIIVVWRTFPRHGYCMAWVSHLDSKNDR